MTSMDRLGRTVLYFSLMVLAAVTGYTAYQQLYGQRGFVPSMRPTFSLPDLSGRRHAIQEWDGRVVLINFWASWCEPCRREIPMLNALQREYGPQGLQIIGVAIDDPGQVRAFQQTLALEYPSLVSPITDMNLIRAYGNHQGGIPYSVLYDRRGMIHYTHIGELHRTELLSHLLPLLKSS